MYYRLCQGKKDFGKFFPETTLPYNTLKSDQKEVFRSVYLYTESQKTEAEKPIRVIKDGKEYTRPKGVAYKVDVDGVKHEAIHDVVGNRLVFDFDSKELNEARSGTKTLIERLISDGISEDSIRIFFSGSKGFHVEIELNKYLSHTEIRNICLSYVEDVPFHDSSIYNPSRILRVELSQHETTGLYKIPLSYSDLIELSIDDIKGAAKMRPDVSILKDAWTIQNFNSNLSKRSKIMAKEVKQSSPNTGLKLTPDFESIKELIKQIDFSNKPTFLSPTKYVLYQGYIPKGSGQDARLILASTMKNAGYSEEDTWRLLKSVSERRVKSFGDEYAFDEVEVWQNIISTVFSADWKGGTYGMNHPILDTIDKMLPIYLQNNRHSTKALTTLDESSFRFRKYAKDIDKNTIRSGIESLDAELRIQTQQVYGVLGSPGSGKTSVALTILNNTNKDKIRSIFFSLDMGEAPVYQKLIQRHTRKTSTEVYNIYKNNNETEILKIEAMLKSNYEHTSFCFKPTLDAEQIEKCILEEEERLGEPIKYIIVDYLDLIRTTASDPTQSSREAIQALRGIAQNLDVAVIVLLQPNKMNSRLNEPVDSYNGVKGSSAVAEVCSAIIGCYRPGASLEDTSLDKYFSVVCLKNRNGSLFRLDFSWHGLTGMIRELEPVERVNLRELKDRKKEEQTDKEKARW